MADFDHLGALSGPGAPDPDVAQFCNLSLVGRMARINVFVVNNVKDIDPTLKND